MVAIAIFSADPVLRRSLEHPQWVVCAANRWIGGMSPGNGNGGCVRR